MGVAIPKGTRDFSPVEMVRRNYIFDTIRTVFKLFTYQCIETPAMEKLSTLMGKYGEEGDKLLFKVLNSGDFLDGVSPQQLENSHTAVKAIAGKGLRYDLTVPFARYVVQHRNDIVLPFRRYQIQPVWRADRPQKGRYREFYQCDADVVGSTSLLNEAELLQIIDQVFHLFGLPVVIKINNRKILSGIAELMGQSEKLVDITVAIDKIDKIGLTAVQNELYARGISEEQFNILLPILTLKGSNQEKLEQLSALLSQSTIGMLGIAELQTIFKYTETLPVTQTIELDLSLARGLHYYTGAIFEVKAVGVEMGSICGGGRYDNLTGIFGLDNVSGVGISFGADRIYDVLLANNQFPQSGLETSRLMFTNIGVSEELYCLKALNELRKHGIASEIYPEQTKLKKQMDYANKRSIPFVVVVGTDEMAENSYTLKNMQLGTQKRVSLDELASNLLSN